MILGSDKRLNIQLRLDFSWAPTGEARQAGREDIESLSVVSEPERPANTNRIMEEVCERANLKEALRQVRRVEIPKPDGGGVRKLGIPTVLDRFIQQAALQVLQRQWNPTFLLCGP